MDWSSSAKIHLFFTSPYHLNLLPLNSIITFVYQRLSINYYVLCWDAWFEIWTAYESPFASLHWHRSVGRNILEKAQNPTRHQPFPFGEEEHEEEPPEVKKPRPIYKITETKHSDGLFTRLWIGSTTRVVLHWLTKVMVATSQSSWLMFLWSQLI